jgi:hypothetical protein
MGFLPSGNNKKEFDLSFRIDELIGEAKILYELF